MSARVRALACRAAYPWERRDASLFRTEAIGEEYVARWRRRVGAETTEALDRLLDDRGLTPDELRRGFASVAPASEAALPGESALAGFLDALDAPPPSTPLRDRDLVGVADVLPPGRGGDDVWLFMDVFARPLGAAEACIRGLPHAELLAPDAVRGALALLSRRLGTAAHRALLSPFGGDAPLLRQAFVGAADVSPWYDLVDRWPVLGRLLGEALASWTDAAGELLQRLETDHRLLGRRFDDGRDPGRAVAISPAGDPHNGGRSVCLVTFESGLEVVYKPNPPDGGSLYRAVAEITRAAGIDLPRCVPPRLERGAYRWERRVAHRLPRGSAERQRFFKRVGIQSRLAQLLDAADLYRENLIPGGDRLWLIDLEVLPTPRPLDGGAALDTPFLSGMLSCPLSGRPGHRALDVGVLGGDGGSWPFPMRVPALDAAGRHVLRTERPPGAGGWRVMAVAGDSAAVRDGWLEVERVLRGCREAFTAALEADAGRPSRCLVRSTHIYQRLLMQSVDPEYLADGRERGMILDRLGRAVANGSLPAGAVEAEVRALARLDIPLFHVEIGSTSLRSDGRVVAQDYLRSPLGRSVRQRIRRAGGSDDAPVRSTIFCASPRARRTAPPSAGARVDRVHPPDDSVWAEAATTLARRVADAALPERPGLPGPAWMGLDLDPFSDAWKLVPLGESLFSGRSGIAAALAAASRLGGNTGLTSLVDTLTEALPTVAVRRLARSAAGPGPAAVGPFFGASAGLAPLVLTGAPTAAWPVPEPPPRPAPSVLDDLSAGLAGLRLLLAPDCAPGWSDYLETFTTAETVPPAFPTGSRWRRRIPGRDHALALLASRTDGGGAGLRTARRGTGDLLVGLRLGRPGSRSAAERYLRRTRHGTGLVALEGAEVALEAWRATDRSDFLDAALERGTRLLRDWRAGDPFPSGWASHRHLLASVGGTSGLILLFAALANVGAGTSCVRLLDPMH